MQKKKAIMIGAGLSNMAAAVYLIQDGKATKSRFTLSTIMDQMMGHLLGMSQMNTGTRIILWRIKRGMWREAAEC